MKNLLAITVMSGLLFGCSSTTSLSLTEKDNAYSKYVIDEKLSSQDKVRGFKFSDWKSLSDNYLIITAAHKKDYLIETIGKCLDLNNSHTIKLNRHSNLAIFQQGDSISLSESSTGKCSIKSIYPITNVQTDYLVNIGKSANTQS